MPIVNPNPDEKTQHAINDVRDAFVQFEAILRGILPPNREGALAFTNLEQAAMWSTKALCVSQAPKVVV